RGGSVILEASNDVADLSLYRRRTRWQAEPGGDGAGGRKTGGGGASVTLKVPPGTLAVDQDGSLLAEPDRPGAREVGARGGVGGRGNVHFKSSTRRAPDYAEPGLKGEEREIDLDLKLIADVGLVGPPNAGKSSLLRAMTAARPKVADYPFTTLDPELGVAETAGTRIVLADIPGLIEGAAAGAGLGQRFLRHVERTRALVYVLDGAEPEPWKTLEVVRREVLQFSPALADRPHVIAVNKIDLGPARRLRAWTRRAAWRGFSRSSTGSASTPPSRLRASSRETRCASPGSSSSISREDRRPWGHVRPHPPRSPGGGAGRDGVRPPGQGAAHPHGRATAPAGHGRRRQAAHRDVQAGDRGRGALRGLGRRGAAQGAVLHRRHTSGAAAALPERRALSDPRVG